MIEKLLKPRNQILLILGLVLVWLAYSFVFVWPAHIQLPTKQDAFLSSIEDGDDHVWEDLISEAYQDQWEFSKSNVLVSLSDVRTNLMALHISWEPEAPEILEDEARLTGDLNFEATALFGADFVTSRLNNLKTPWVFTWKKESWKPWSWKLVRIENPSLSLDGYRPGDIGRRLGNRGL